MYDIDMPLLVDTGLFWLHVAHPARRLKPSGISRVGSEEYYCTIFALVCPWEAGQVRALEGVPICYSYEMGEGGGAGAWDGK